MCNRSFTLIELLIVLVIIAIVATLAIPKYEEITTKAQAVEAKQVLRAISDALWRYYLEAGHFPPEDPSRQPIPSVIDISLSDMQSKYFNYAYYNDSDIEISIKAYRKVLGEEEIPSLPSLGLIAYEIFFLYDTPFQKGEPGQKMDEHWYRYYSHEILEEEYPFPGGQKRRLWYWP